MRLVFLFIILFFISCNYKTEALKTNDKASIEDNKDFILMKKNIKENNFKEAFSIFEKLSVLYPKNEKLYYQLYDISKNSSSDLKKLINILKLLLSINPQNNKLYYELANNYFLLENDKEAINSYDTFLKYYPNDFSANYKLAYVYFVNRKYELAKRYFLKTIEIDDKFLWSYYYLAKIYMDYEENAEEAIKLLTLAKKKISLNEFNKDIDLELAISYFKNKKYEEAIKLFNNLKYKNNEVIISYILESYKKLKKYDEGILFMMNLIKKDHLNTKNIYELAKLYILKDDYSKAISTLRYLIKIDSNPRYLYSLGLLYFNFNDNDNLKEIRRLLSESKQEDKYKYLKLLKEKISERNYIKGKSNLPVNSE